VLQAISASHVKSIEERDKLLRDAESAQQTLQRTVEGLRSNLSERDEKIGELESQVASLQTRCEEHSQEIDKLHDVRKVLHNQVQDLKVI